MFTSIHFLGIVLALAYFIASFFANRIKNRAIDNASKDEQFIIFEARPNEDGFGDMVGQTISYFMMAIVLAYFINTLPSFISGFIADLITDPVGLVIGFGTFMLMQWKGKFSNRNQEDKLQEERAEIASNYLTETYLKAERKASWLSMTPLFAFFVYLVIAF